MCTVFGCHCRGQYWKTIFLSYDRSVNVVNLLVWPVQTLIESCLQRRNPTNMAAAKKLLVCVLFLYLLIPVVVFSLCIGYFEKLGLTYCLCYLSQDQMNERGFFLNTSIGSNVLFLASLDKVRLRFHTCCPHCDGVWLSNGSEVNAI